MQQQHPGYYSRQAKFRAAFRTGVPVLMYHQVARPRWGVKYPYLSVPPALFARQMRELLDAGMVSGDLSDAAGGVQAEKNGKIVITFDDGFENVFRNAMPVLKECGFRAIQFIVSGFIGKRNSWDEALDGLTEPLMDEAQIREWLAQGHRIGAHTRTHRRLPSLPSGAMREEIESSKKELEDRFGVAVEDFCYPHGAYDQRVADMVQEVGFKTACTIRFGVNRQGVNPFQLLRMTARRESRGLKHWVRQWKTRGLQWEI